MEAGGGFSTVGDGGGADSLSFPESPDRIIGTLAEDLLSEGFFSPI
jgi:hypothetical protein